MRIGNSIDYHKYAYKRDLILGGVKIPFNKGLIGDSDADPIMHSISEAILGALALGDLGTYFNKDNAPFDSKEILLFSLSKLKETKYKISNIDCMVLIEKPKLKDYIFSIRENLSKIMNLDINRISIKATTMEKDGIIGKVKGVMAISQVLLEE